MDVEGNVQYNEKIDNTPEKIRYHLGNIPRENTKLVIESSSIWKAPFFQIRDELGMDVMLRGGYIVVPHTQQKDHGAPGSGGIAAS